MFARHRSTINKVTVYGFLLLAVLLLQTTCMHYLTIGDVKPSLLVVSVVCVALFSDYRTGTVFGGVLGLLCDVSSAAVFGYFTLILMLVGFCVGVLSDAAIRRSLPSALLVYFCAYAAYFIILILTSVVIVGNFSVLPYRLRVTFFEMLYSLIFLPVVYLAARKINTFLTNLDSR